jgi:hypothetical protein
MMTPNDRLYALLPAIYRIRDAEKGYPLRALLRVIEEQAGIVEDDILHLYDNWFIETCEDWVVPYLGDLLGYLPLRNSGTGARERSSRDRERARVLIPRRDVAHTIRYRRRKGTLPVLELLARDVADWPARAVEFYRLLGWTQDLNHQHLARGRTADLRDGNSLDWVDGPFDRIAHTVDARRIVSRHKAGRYNIPDVGVFACRLKSYPVTRTPAFHVDTPGPKQAALPHNYTFSVLGNDAPLFTRPVPENDPWHIAGEQNLPVPVRRWALTKGNSRETYLQDTSASEALYGPGKSLSIWASGWPPEKGPAKEVELLIPADRVIPADLTGWKYSVPKNHVAVDPVLGRIMFPASQKKPQRVSVSYHYGFPDDIGGGEYRRIIPGPDLAAVSELRSGDISDPRKFVERLVSADRGTDPFSVYLGDHLSPETKERAKGPAPGPDNLGELVARDLDAVLYDETLADPAHWGNLPLPAGPEGQSGRKPEGARLMRRNRLLLEARYPKNIAVSYALYRVGANEKYRLINDALARWKDEGPVHAVIEIADSGVYVEQLSIDLRKGQSLSLRAADRTRPVLRQLNWQTSGPDAIDITGGQGSRLVLDGLLITGRGLRISGPDLPDDAATAEEDLCEVVIRHCTLVPGWSIDCECRPEHGNEPSIEIVTTRSQLRIEKCIVGSIVVSADNVRTEPNRIRIRDSILDATGNDLDAISAEGNRIAHSVLSFERCTVIGEVSTHAIVLAQDSIFTGTVKVARSQIGCMRFCYVPYGSRTPRKFKCLPDSLTAVEGMTDEEKEYIRRRIRPQFRSTLYGTPGYCQLSALCPEEVQGGAEDESEMGVYHDLYQPQRRTNLSLRLAEYTPTGMESGIIFIT